MLRTLKSPARNKQTNKQTPKHLSLEQNPSVQIVQHQNPVVENPVLQPVVQDPVVDKKLLISPPAINRSFTEELGSVNITECITCNICKSIYQNIATVRLHQATDHPHLTVYCDDDACPFIFKTKCGMTKHLGKKHLKILKPSKNVHDVENVNGDPTTVPMSGDSFDNSSDVLNLSSDGSNSGDQVDVFIKTENSSVAGVSPKKRGRPKLIKREKQ